MLNGFTPYTGRLTHNYGMNANDDPGGNNGNNVDFSSVYIRKNLKLNVGILNSLVGRLKTDQNGWNGGRTRFEDIKQLKEFNSTSNKLFSQRWFADKQ